ncbi:MAG: hypothetical protein AB9915_00610 [Candidatus Dojkabacteria bacterium]
MEEKMLNQMNRSLNLADLMFRAAGKQIFTTLIEADETGRDVKNISARWTGGIGRNDLPTISAIKAFCLLSKGSINGVSTVPTMEGYVLKGVARDENLIIACAGSKDEHVELMLALLLQYSMRQEVRFHHVGYRFKNDEDRASAINIYLAEHKTPVHVLPAKDHIRHFIEVVTSKSENGRYWKEYQTWPNGSEPETDGIHIDVATTDPERMIEYISKHSGLKAEYWMREKNSPCAMVSFVEEGTQFAIMARSSWTDVGTW